MHFTAIATLALAALGTVDAAGCDKDRCRGLKYLAVATVQLLAMYKNPLLGVEAATDDRTHRCRSWCRGRWDKDNIDCKTPQALGLMLACFRTSQGQLPPPPPKTHVARAAFPVTAEYLAKMHVYMSEVDTFITRVSPDYVPAVNNKEAILAIDQATDAADGNDNVDVDPEDDPANKNAWWALLYLGSIEQLKQQVKQNLKHK